MGIITLSLSWKYKVIFNFNMAYSSDSEPDIHGPPENT
jgi:hypothetical protein